MNGETEWGQDETPAIVLRLYLVGCMNSWCPGLSDSVSDRLSIHQTELSVLELPSSVFLGETFSLKSSCPRMLKDEETEWGQVETSAVP